MYNSLVVFVSFLCANHARRLQDSSGRSAFQSREIVAASKSTSSLLASPQEGLLDGSSNLLAANLLLTLNPSLNHPVFKRPRSLSSDASRMISSHPQLSISGPPRLVPPKGNNSRPLLRRHISTIGKSASDSFSNYKSGVKLLGSEVQEWWRLRRNPEAAATWREHKLKKRVPRDVLRMLPIVANPLPPPFGLSVPLIASVFPRKFLTRQFWTQDQQIEFHECDHRSRWAKPLLQQYQLLEAEGAKSFADAKALLTSGEAQAPCELCSLSRAHILALSRSWLSRGLIPFRLLSSHRLRELLRRKAAQLREDYHLLRKESLLSLEERELWYGCLELGLRADNISPYDALQNWLRLLEMPTDGDPPSSLLLHAPLLLQWEQLGTNQDFSDFVDSVAEECTIDLE